MGRRKQSRISRFRSQVGSFLSGLTHKKPRQPHPFEEAARTIKEASHVARGTGTGPAHRSGPVDRDIERIAADGYKQDEGSHRG